MTKLIIHTASLYRWWPDDYTARLDDRIHAALDAGLDGVEISNGPAILDWQPRPDTLRRLRDKIVTIHAELISGVTLEQWRRAVKALPLRFRTAVFHPDELRPDEFGELRDLPVPALIENMDARRADWRTADEMRAVMPSGVGWCFDTAHAQEHDLNASSFAPLGLPAETHLSIVTDDCTHAMTSLRPAQFPAVPSACPIVTIEGLIPPSMDALRTEVEHVRQMLTMST